MLLVELKINSELLPNRPNLLKLTAHEILKTMNIDSFTSNFFS